MENRIDEKWGDDIKFIKMRARETIPALKAAIDEYYLSKDKGGVTVERIKNLEEWYDILNKIVTAEVVTEDMIIELWRLIVLEGGYGHGEDSGEKNRGVQ